MLKKLLAFVLEINLGGIASEEVEQLLGRPCGTAIKLRHTIELDAATFLATHQRRESSMTKRLR
jgi:hypothetical protein